MTSTAYQDSAIEPIAVIGMAGRFPRARSVEEFWANVRDGVHCVSFFEDDELLRAGVPAAALRHPNYVKARAVLEDVELFDATFFGYAPSEAQVMDPQHRVFLECAFSALEDAGYANPAHAGSIGVYAGAGLNTYLLHNLGTHPEMLYFGGYDKDYLATRVSYKLNLKGPSIVIQTACSTSLVAICQAAQALLTYQCDIALAGGVAIALPDRAGYFFAPGAIFSPDGHCRAFDAAAQGIVPGNGVGVVVLKRLQDAIADGDVVHAVIRGFAVNNDGGSKVGYTAPSVEGQAQVILMAQALAGVSPETITYIEAHGTGTALGDPIEIAALTQAFRAGTGKNGFCALGSVKTNVGHLDAAAGVTGFVKTVLALRRRTLPPSLHFERPNPKIDFSDSPFFVTTQLREWTAGETPLRAGVSSFGIGGTNAHVILEEAPAREPSSASRPWTVLTLSARTASALDVITADLARYLAAEGAADLADVAFTLQVGRKLMPHRRAIICRDLAGAIGAVETRDPGCTRDRVGEEGAVPIAFMFPDDDGLTVGAGVELYRQEPAFRAALEECLASVAGDVRRDLLDVLCPADDVARQRGAALLVQGALRGLALFAFEYALAQLWISWGVTPAASIGDGAGQTVAASIAGRLPVAEAMRAGGLVPSAHIDGRPFAVRSGEVAASGVRVFLEVGPGRMLCDLVGPALSSRGGVRSGVAIASLAEPSGLVQAIAELWLEGASLDWKAYYQSERRLRVQLPGYPFERQRYWLEPRRPSVEPTVAAVPPPADRHDVVPPRAAAADRARAAGRPAPAPQEPLHASALNVAARLGPHEDESKEFSMTESPSRNRADRSDVAIVGMAGRFPGAPAIDAFWENLRAGVESRTVFTDDEVLAQGVPRAALTHPSFIRSGFVLDDIDQFDAAFFGINPREAELLDPQHRIFLECAWEALENAGYDSETYQGAIGVFGGATLSSYLTQNVLRNGDVLQNVGGRQAVFGSVPDYMVTRVAYKLNLQGPAYFVQSACSTSLVAVHLACQSLANHECDVVLAGGVSVAVPHRLGYVYEEGGMLSPDGICRTFDANARGTIFGSGVGIVVLKRLADAIADGDTIHAVIKGAAANNDGSLKVGFTAPGVIGQSRVISEALGAAGVPAETISYIEAHGTGTELGDPIEIAALTRAFRASTDRRQFCAVGSVKPNIGHLDAAAGVSSLIKTVLAMKHRQIPPTINFDRPNPKIDFDDSPFFVNTTLVPWERTNGTPRRAGVSSFGFGGTNAHIIVEEAPPAVPAAPSRAQQIVVLAARTEQALEQATNRLAESLQRHARPIADVAYTLALGRRHFACRRAVVCAEGEDAVEMLQGRDPRRIFSATAASKDRPVVFMFPGQGSQYVNMARDLYREERRFRQIVDECAEGLRAHLGLDLRDVLYPAADDAAASERLRQTSITQSALFTVEYALARLWMSWGVKPDAMIGHSIGEIVAACLAGVFSLQDALALVALRGTLMESMPPGAMAAVPLPADQVTRVLGSGLSIAAVNAPSLCVVSGEPEALDQFIQARGREGIECRRLHTSHAFHSALMDGAVAAFTDAVRGVERRAPAIPFVSNATGAWITDADAIDPQYWGTHIRQPVRFSDGIAQLLSGSERLLLEVGPGNTLSALVRQQRSGAALAIASLRHPQERTSDLTTVLSALGRLWVSGAAVDWAAFYADERRRRVPLPSYPFERQRFWVDAEKFSAKKALLGIGMMQRKDFSDWFHVVSWKLSASQMPLLADSNEACLVFEDDGCSARIAARLAASGRPVLRVRPGARFEAAGENAWTIAPGSREDYAALISSLDRAGRLPGTIVHAWGFTGAADANPDDAAIAGAQDRGFYSLLYLAQALGGRTGSTPVQLGVLTDGVHEVIGREAIAPEKATVLGPCRVIPQEFPTISCRHVDVSTAESPDLADGQLDAIIADLITGSAGPLIGYRRGKRWLQTCDTARLEAVTGGAHPRLRRRGTYLITGGFGGIGQVFAEYLAEHFQARLVLTGRRALPPREEWDAVLAGAGDAATRRRIQAVQRLEALGAEVLVGEADVTDEPRMRAVVADARARFGRIDGVIHSAGIAGGGVIQLKTKDVAAAVLAPKVQGTQILARSVADQPLDFLLLCSSLTALVGGVGQVDYCAANSYLDAFARQFHAATGTFTVAVNWNAWREVGMAVETNVPEDLRDSLKGAMLATGITNQQGVDAFLRVLARCADRQVAISPNDLGLLATAIALVEDQELAPAEPATNREKPAAVAAHSAPSTYHPRPPLATPYVMARNETEERICAVWQDLLGIDRIGVNDNFFELGGHSLLAIRVMIRVNQVLKTDIPVARLYDGLTVAFLASVAGTNGQQPAPEAEEADDDDAERRRERARRQREQQARRRGAVREIAST